MNVSLSTWVLWGMFLILQNAAFTFVSRARNSGSYGLHIVAALCSNGVWIIGQFVSLALIIETIRVGTMFDKTRVVAFYTVATVIGSVVMHWIGKNYIETGKRKVGA